MNTSRSPQRLRWLLAHVAPGPSPTSDDRNVNDSQEWGVLKTTPIKWDGWDWRQHKVLPPDYWGLTDAEVKVGDVIVTKAGPRNRVDVSAYVDETPPRLTVSGKMLLLQANPDFVDPKFLS